MISNCKIKYTIWRKIISHWLWRVQLWLGSNPEHMDIWYSFQTRGFFLFQRQNWGRSPSLWTNLDRFHRDCLTINGKRSICSPCPILDPQLHLDVVLLLFLWNDRATMANASYAKRPHGSLNVSRVNIHERFNIKEAKKEK